MAVRRFEAIKACGIGEGKARDRIGAIAGDLATVEEMYALKGLMHGARLGRISTAGRMARRSTRHSDAQAYLFNPTIEGIEQADALLLDRHKPALRGFGAERPHPQALADGAISPIGCDRQCRRHALRLRACLAQVRRYAEGSRRQAIGRLL